MSNEPTDALSEALDGASATVTTVSENQVDFRIVRPSGEVLIYQVRRRPLRTPVTAGR